MTDIGKARVQIEFDQSQATQATEDMGGGLLDKFKDFGIGARAALAGGIAGGALAAGKALYDIGGTFDDVADTIRVGTGATGEALDGLVDSAKNIATSVPASFEASAQTVADLNARLGLTGPVLETLASQMLEAGRITGEALDVNTFSAAFSAFGVAGEQTTEVMDQLFRVSQDTGVGMNQLAASVQKGGPQLQQFGFDIGESAALLGSLDKAGLRGEAVIGSMSRAMVTFAKDGREPKAALQETASSISDFLAKGEDAKALDMASTLFGTKGAGQFVEAVRSGVLDVEQLTSVVAGSGDTILGAAEDTADFSEKWEMFKNNALLAVEPIATRVFDALGEGMGIVNQLFGIFSEGDFKAGPLAEDSPVIDFAFKLRDAFTEAVDVAGPMFDKVSEGFDRLKEVAQQVWETVSPILADIGGVIVSVFGEGEGASGTFQKLADTVGVVMSFIADLWSSQWAAIKALWDVFGPTILDALKVVFETIKGVISGAMDFVQGILKTVMSLIRGDWDGAWEGIKQALSGAWTMIQSIIKGAIDLVASVLSNAWGAIKGTVSSAWDGIKSAVSSGIDGMMSFITGIPGRVTSALGNLGRLLWDSGASLIQGLIDGIRSKIADVGDAAADVASKIRGFFPGSPVKAGPLTSWNNGGAGRRLGDMLISGMDDSVRGVAAASSRLAGAVSAGAQASFTIAGGGGASASALDYDLLAAAVRDGAAAGTSRGMVALSSSASRLAPVWGRR